MNARSKNSLSTQQLPPPRSTHESAEYTRPPYADSPLLLTRKECCTPREGFPPSQLPPKNLSLCLNPPRFEIMAKGGISKRKQTRNFLKSGQLESQLDARKKRKQFQQKVKQRDSRRNKGVLPAHQRPQNEDESEEEFEEVKRRRQERDDDEESELGGQSDQEFDVDQLLGAEGLEEGGDEDGQGDVSESR